MFGSLNNGLRLKIPNRLNNTGVNIRITQETNVAVGMVKHPAEGVWKRMQQGGTTWSGTAGDNDGYIEYKINKPTLFDTSSNTLNSGDTEIWDEGILDLSKAVFLTLIEADRIYVNADNVILPKIVKPLREFTNSNVDNIFTENSVLDFRPFGFYDNFDGNIINTNNMEDLGLAGFIIPSSSTNEFLRISQQYNNYSELPTEAKTFDLRNYTSFNGLLSLSFSEFDDFYLPTTIQSGLTPNLEILIRNLTVNNATSDVLDLSHLYNLKRFVANFNSATYKEFIFPTGNTFVENISLNQRSDITKFDFSNVNNVSDSLTIDLVSTNNLTDVKIDTDYQNIQEITIQNIRDTSWSGVDRDFSSATFLDDSEFKLGLSSTISQGGNLTVSNSEKSKMRSFSIVNFDLSTQSPYDLTDHSYSGNNHTIILNRCSLTSVTMNNSMPNLISLNLNNNNLTGSVDLSNLTYNNDAVSAVNGVQLQLNNNPLITSLDIDDLVLRNVEMAGIGLTALDLSTNTLKNNRSRSSTAQRFQIQDSSIQTIAPFGTVDGAFSFIDVHDSDLLTFDLATNSSWLEGVLPNGLTPLDGLTPVYHIQSLIFGGGNSNKDFELIMPDHTVSDDYSIRDINYASTNHINNKIIDLRAFTSIPSRQIVMQNNSVLTTILMPTRYKSVGTGNHTAQILTFINNKRLVYNNWYANYTQEECFHVNTNLSNNRFGAKTVNQILIDILNNPNRKPITINLTSNTPVLDVPNKNSGIEALEVLTDEGFVITTDSFTAHESEMTGDDVLVGEIKSENTNIYGQIKTDSTNNNYVSVDMRVNPDELAFDNSNDDSVKIHNETAWDTTNDIGRYIEITFTPTGISGINTDNNVLIGQSTFYRSRLVFNSTTFSIVGDNDVSIPFSWSPVNNTEYTVRVELVGVETFELFIDGVSLGTNTINSGVIFWLDLLGKRSTTHSQGFNGVISKVKTKDFIFNFEEIGNDVIIRNDYIKDVVRATAGEIALDQAKIDYVDLNKSFDFPIGSYIEYEFQQVELGDSPRHLMDKSKSSVGVINDATTLQIQDDGSTNRVVFTSNVSDGSVYKIRWERETDLDVRLYVDNVDLGVQSFTTSPTNLNFDRIGRLATLHTGKFILKYMDLDGDILNFDESSDSRFVQNSNVQDVWSISNNLKLDSTKDLRIEFPSDKQPLTSNNGYVEFKCKCPLWNNNKSNVLTADNFGLWMPKETSFLLRTENNSESITFNYPTLSLAADTYYTFKIVRLHAEDAVNTFELFIDGVSQGTQTFVASSSNYAVDAIGKGSGHTVNGFGSSNATIEYVDINGEYYDMSEGQGGTIYRR